MEVDIDSGVRNKRKEKALEAISNLINNDQDQSENVVPKVEEVKEHKTKEKHHKESSDKHNSKKKKKSKHK